MVGGPFEGPPMVKSTRMRETKCSEVGKIPATA